MTPATTTDNGPDEMREFVDGSLNTAGSLSDVHDRVRELQNSYGHILQEQLTIDGWMGAKTELVLIHLMSEQPPEECKVPTPKPKSVTCGAVQLDKTLRSLKASEKSPVMRYLCRPTKPQGRPSILDIRGDERLC